MAQTSLSMTLDDFNEPLSDAAFLDGGDLAGRRACIRQTMTALLPSCAAACAAGHRSTTNIACCGQPVNMFGTASRSALHAPTTAALRVGTARVSTSMSSAGPTPPCTRASAPCATRPEAHTYEPQSLMRNS